MENKPKKCLDRVTALHRAARFARTVSTETGFDWTPTWETEKTIHETDWDWIPGAVLRTGEVRVKIRQVNAATCSVPADFQYAWSVEILGVGVTFTKPDDDALDKITLTVCEAVGAAVGLVDEWYTQVEDARGVLDRLSAMLETLTEEG